MSGTALQQSALLIMEHMITHIVQHFKKGTPTQQVFSKMKPLVLVCVGLLALLGLLR